MLSSPSPRWLNKTLRERSRSTSCRAGQEGAASSGASKSFSIQAEYRFSVPRFQLLRKGQMLPPSLPGRGGSWPRTAISRVNVLHSADSPWRTSLACQVASGGRGDLGKPEIGRPAVALMRFGGDAAIGRDQRKLAVERLLRSENHAQRRAFPWRGRRGQDGEPGRIFASVGRLFGHRGRR